MNDDTQVGYFQASDFHIKSAEEATSGIRSPFLNNIRGMIEKGIKIFIEDDGARQEVLMDSDGNLSLKQE